MIRLVAIPLLVAGAAFGQCGRIVVNPVTGGLDCGGFSVPSGGTTGQVLTKSSNTSYDIAWGTTAGAGDVLGGTSLTTAGRMVSVTSAGTVGELSAVTVSAGVITATGFSGPLTGTASAIAGGSGGQVPYQTGAGVTAFDAGLAFNALTGLGIIHDVTVGQAGTASGCLNANGTTSGTVKLCAQDVAGSVTFKLPAADGSDGQFIKTNGSGVLSFGAPAGAGTVTVSGGGNLTSTAFMTGAGTQVSQTPSATSTLDASGNAAFAGTVTATAVKTGGTPPSVTAGTGGVVAYGEGTAPSVCAAAGVDCLYADSTAHALMASYNNDTAAKLVRGPASATSGNLASYSDTTGGLVQDASIAAANVVTAASNYTSGQFVKAAGNNKTTSSATIVAADLPVAERTRTVECTFDGGGSTLTQDSVCYKRIPIAGTIIGWAIEAVGSSPACTIDVLKIAAGATLPTSSITASATPALTSTDNAAKSTTLTSWTTSMTADDIVGFKVTTPGAATWAHISVYYTVN